MDFKTFFNQLFLSRQMKFDEGELTIFGQPVVMMPAYTIVELQKFIEYNYKNGTQIIYKAAKAAGIKYVSTFKKQFNPKSPESLLETCLNLLGLGGSGKITIIKFNFKSKSAVFHVTNSPWAMLRGREKFPVDNFLAGFLAGGCEEIFNKRPIDIKEITCQAMGKSYCEFITISNK